jgi:iron complex transport system substrate-binding protein
MLRCLLALCLLAGGVAHAAAERVVTLGGSVTEIVFELGQGKRLVADDESSMYPDAARELPRIGYYRSVPVEGVVAMRPDLILASENAGPPKALERLQGLGIPLVSVSDKPSIESLYARIKEIASELQVPEAGQRLADRVRADVAAAQAAPSTARRAVVLINRTGPLLGAGGNTAANSVLAMAGLENALARQTGYKPVSAEGLAMLAPDLIIVSEASVAASGGLEKLKSNPAIASTPAAREGRIVAVNDLLILGIGPRVGQAIRLLKDAAR